MTAEIDVKDLYRNAVDRKDVRKLATYLSDNVNFRICNHAPVVGKEQVLAANQTFFDSIASMTHQIDGIYADGDTTICNGSVDYLRLDGSGHSAFFSTTLRFENNQIVDYLVFADISGL
ncbi:nuclear transport factor 2 family protein [Thalassospira lucentensis]|uniref:nuclear transport factor 2 family protein n=1 Tax=Thalassospira lucentensis TaxID=168935 RepID=UPI0003B77E67|nr:nuclear transport factor 2 family protein [Thalassospira lucentensis]RCK29757.1 hypothetical protein TH1_02650 [Thalassospira lucentensis MCCC 1A00383 = DSM 14000]